MQRTLHIAVFVALLPTAFAAGQKKGPDDIGNAEPGKGVNFYSIEKEIALGKQMALEAERQSRPVDDPVIGEYVNRSGQNLARNSDAKVRDFIVSRRNTEPSPE